MTDAVGLVVVSHSRALARAAIELAAEMLHGDAVRIEEAAGLDDGAFGTDAVRVADAIARADAGRGVVVLMDLGSAVLSAEVALDLLDPDIRDRVALCPAPVVEGLCVAAVAAAGGAGPEEVAAEARRALAAKEEHLGVADHAVPEHDMATRDVDAAGNFEIGWAHGLHARPAAVLVRAARGLDADVRIRNVTLGGEPVPAASLSRVAALGAEQGHVIEVTGRGPDARRAVERLLTLAATGFGDLDGPAPVAPVTQDCVPAGGPLPASPGIALGPAWLVSDAPATAADDGPPDDDLPVGDAAAEWAGLRVALKEAATDVRRARDHTAAVAGEPEAGIFDAHLLLLDDPDLVGRAHARIGAGEGAITAWRAAADTVAEALAGLPDAYQRARAADVRAVAAQVEAHLRRHQASSGFALYPTEHRDGDPEMGAEQSREDEREAAGPSAAGPSAAAPSRCVLVARDLTPAEAAALDPGRIAAVVLAAGTPTAHSVLLLRALGIPAVVAAGPRVLALAPRTLLAVDGTRGELVVDPTADVRAGLEERAAIAGRRRETARARGAEPAVTRDGVEIHVGANLASLDDGRAAAAAGADLAGLVRTELLFLDRTTPPGVDEQVAVYQALAESLPGRRLVVRTLDVGGDKPLPYVPMVPEANPFLGVRGIRLTLRRPELLLDQLRAVVRVARDHPLDVMFPMVTSVEELLTARRVLEDAARVEGGAVPQGLRVGIMVEVPATALKAPAFAPHVDFLSIGTNDLTQYALAAERGNDAVAAAADPLDPGVLALIAATCSAETTVGVCGELAADELAAGLLVGLGVRELSVVPGLVPTVKQAVREVDAAAAARLAQEALRQPDAAGVRALLGRART